MNLKDILCQPPKDNKGLVSKALDKVKEKAKNPSGLEEALKSKAKPKSISEALSNYKKSKK